MNERTGVLVVEDDPDLAGVVRDILASVGYAVDVARNGLDALAQVERHMPAVIVLDMLMPVMDGWQFAREYHARYGHRSPIIVVTAAEHARQRAAEISADDVLAKPFDVASLIATVQRFTGGPSQSPGS
jgi:CheY-like chemotaxis protein